MQTAFRISRNLGGETSILGSSKVLRSGIQEDRLKVVLHEQLRVLRNGSCDFHDLIRSVIYRIYGPKKMGTEWKGWSILHDIVQREDDDSGLGLYIIRALAARYQRQPEDQIDA